MNRNCKAYAAYGGRGNPRWFQYENFFADMGPCPKGLTLERIDNSRGYCKANCEWRTVKQQARNRRSTRIVEYQGRIMSLAEAAELSGADYKTIAARLKKWGCTFEESLIPTLVIRKNWTAKFVHQKLEELFDEMEAEVAKEQILASQITPIGAL
jgi:hypothetical protein